MRKKRKQEGEIKHNELKLSGYMNAKIGKDENYKFGLY